MRTYAAVAALPIVVLAAAGFAQEKPKLKAPPVVTPGPVTGMVAPPSDAVVLFDGTSGKGWKGRAGGEFAWKVADGAMMASAGAGDVVTEKTFGDAQIHVEFMTPTVAGAGQDKGNSGVYIHGRYEVQVLDSYGSETYPDGQCGAVYGQYVPLANACRKPGEWQTYDIVFHAAKFDGAGARTAPARLTVIHNGVLIQDNVELKGPTGGAIGKEEVATGPVLLQEHGHEVRYRNIWYRPL